MPWLSVYMFVLILDIETIPRPNFDYYVKDKIRKLLLLELKKQGMTLKLLNLLYFIHYPFLARCERLCYA